MHDIVSSILYQFLVLFQQFEEECKNRSEIKMVLEEVCSENPLDEQKSKGIMRASIILKNPKKIVKVPPMQYTPEDRKEFGIQIQELLEMKVIIPSFSPHMSPAFLVEKEAEKRRGKKRMVVNYKAINKETIGDAYMLPKKEELLTIIRGKTIFSSFDCKSGSWQVLLDEESQKLTASTYPEGHFQRKVVPFGLKQAPSIFQRHMDNSFKELKEFCTVYVDDILIFSTNKNDHNNKKRASFFQRKTANFLKKKLIS